MEKNYEQQKIYIKEENKYENEYSEKKLLEKFF